MRRALALLVVATVLACKGGRDRDAAPAQERTEPAHAADAHAGWLVDDVPLATTRAKESGRLLFVDAWAEWCHTCWSMKRDVLSDARVLAFADRFVFVEVDTDRAENAAFLVDHPVRLWPTFFVIEPLTGRTVAVRPGAMSLDDTVAFLERAHASARGGDDVDRALSQGYAQLFAGDAKGALPHFERALGTDSPRRTEAVLAAMRAARETKDAARAVTLAEGELARLGAHALVYDVASAMHFIAAASGDQALAEKARARAEGALTPLVDAPPPGLSVDDRADLMATLAELYAARGDDVGRRALLTASLALMESDAAAARTPEAARVHDYARMNALLALGRGDDAVALLRTRTVELPSSYEAWARLASALVQLGRHAEARPAMEKALALSYGPRRLRYLVQMGDILAALDDQPGARAHYERATTENAALPAHMRLDAVAEGAQKKWAALAPDADNSTIQKSKK